MTGFDRIPAELRELPRWIVWRWGDVDPKTGKRKKPPYCPGDHSRYASSTEPGTWGSFEQAVTLVNLGAVDGLGFALAPPYVGIDLDSELTEAEQWVIMLALDSYAERSVSGSGFHVIVRADLNGRGRHPVGFGVFQDARFFYCTGEHVLELPATIEERQAELEQVLAQYLPPPTTAGPTLPPQPVDLDDQELLEIATHASDGGDFERMWRGDASEYDEDDSRADYHLCKALAFYTGRDPNRIDRMFRASGLMRDKWLREDYRERTIRAAINATTDVYQRVRPAGDAPGRSTRVRPEDVGRGAGASRVPAVKGRGAGRTYAAASVVTGEDVPTGTHQGDETSPVEAEEAKKFAAVDEASAKPLLGDDENTVLAAGGSAVYYGDGGAGKTTLGLDRAFHYCAGLEWLGIAVPNPLRVLWIENEGPRGKFRTKVRAKLEAWDGPPLEERLHVLVAPWARFTFANDSMRVGFIELVRRLEIGVVIAGPIARLGAKGGGTPEEIQAFVDLLELVRVALERPLAYELIHHENKAGDVSGAWEGATDTLVHVRARGNGHTAIVWQKARWAPELHGKTWKLDWQAGERFALDETPETTDDEIADKLVELIRAAPGQSWNKYDELLSGRGKRKRVIRDELLEDGRLVNQGTDKSMRLFLPEQVAETLLDGGEAEAP